MSELHEPLSVEELCTLTRWADEPGVCNTRLASHRNLLRRAAFQLERLQARFYEHKNEVLTITGPSATATGQASTPTARKTVPA